MTDAGSRYPFLSQLLGGWFHQDFDLDGETLEEVIASYKSTSTEAELAGLKRDIAHFLADIEKAGADCDARFIEVFQPDIDPTAWDMTTRQWLETISRLA